MSRDYGPEDFGGTDEGSHFMSQQRADALVSAERPPKPASGPAVWGLVIADMKARDAFGTLKYGQRLVAHDGRDALKDAYQEALDLAVYLRKMLLERDGE